MPPSRDDETDSRWPFRDDASIRSVGMRIAFENQVSSTELGRRSSEMRRKASLLHADRKKEEAFALFEQAAALHSPDDTSAAAAMCWYNLAETYKRRRDGIRVSNLRAAEELYRRALGCPPLARDLHRAAKVRDGLASCLRHLAEEAPGRSRVEALLKESAKLFREAIDLAAKCGEVERETLAGYLHNLGNLEAQQGNLDAAVRCFDEAEGHARRVIRSEQPGSLGLLLSEALVHGAQSRAKRGAPGDLERAVSLLREAIQMAHPGALDLAHLTLGEVLLDMGPEHAEEAVRELRQARLEQLDTRRRPQWVALCERAGLHGDALRVLHLEIHRIMKERAETLADHTADTYAARAQQAAHWAARLEAAKGQPLEAFFTLELVSGMRFAEAIGFHCERAATPLARALQNETHAVGTAAAILDHTANFLALVPVAEQRSALRAERDVDQSTGRDERPEDAGMRLRLEALTEKAFAQAIPHADPAGALRQEAQRLKRRAMDLGQRLDAIAPEVREPRPWLHRLTPEVVQGLLKEHPGHALIHLSMAEDFLVVAVWLEGDELIARSHRAEVPEGLLEQLAVHGADRESADPSTMDDALAKLDLSPALPAGAMAHGVLLPSFAASLLPLAALGPPGKTLLDRFLALSWMPCLSPLFERQSAHRPRQGTVSVAPGQTVYHDIALSIGVPDETRILDGAATLSNVLAAATTADVMCFYTHGEHTGELSAALELHDGKLDRQHLLSRWAGMERVELWACASGVNLPHDPLTPPVDEAFGFDSELLKVGVRSTIGTLWPVSDLETSILVARYRVELNRGKSPPRALADAQRAVRDDPAEVLRSIEPKAGATPASGNLGPQEPRPASRRTFFSTPLSWAGFRFIGVAERRPLREWGPEDERELTADEAAELERMLADTEPERFVLRDWQETQLAEATALSAEAAPTADQAIRVARLYRDRVFSSRQHNLLAGLAWIHEALAHAGSTGGKKAQPEARRRLRTEAAWLWVDIARGERLSRAEWVLQRPDPVAAARARALLGDLPDSPHVRALGAWVQLVGSDLSSTSQYEAALRDAWQRMLPVLEARLPEGYEGIRTLTAAGELALLAGDVVPGAALRCLEHIRQAGRLAARKMGQVVAIARLRSVEALLARDAGGAEARLPGPDALPSFEAAREGIQAWIALWRAPTAEAPEQRELANHYFDHLESMFWGVPDDDRSPMWRSTGTLGPAYRRLLGTWMWQMSRAVAGESMAVQMIAGLQASAELRLAAISRWSRLAGTIGEEAGGPLGRLALFARDREAIFERLDEAALLADYALLAKDLGHPRFEPSRLDPFRCSVSEVQRTSTDDDLVPWFLGESCKEAPAGPAEAYTAAFAAVRKAELLTDFMGGLWRALCERSDERLVANIDATPRPLQSLLDPGVRLSDREDLLRQVPPGWVVVGLGEDLAGRLVLASVSRSAGTLEGRVYGSPGPAGAMIRQSLARLHTASAVAETVETHAERRRAWKNIEEALSPALEAVLGAELDRGRPMIAVLAPGGLRSLPYLGVRVRGRPLFESVGGVLHIPSLSVEPTSNDGSREACVFGKDPVEGDTSFGEAVVETLRRWFEPTVIRPAREQTTDIVEADQIDAVSRQLRALRLYGAESTVSTSPVLAGLNVGGRRRFSDQNTRGTFLPRCEVVELWADTAGAGPAMGARHDDRDRIPGLARSFLLSGAAYVVDLAWRIPDIVKALLCERFGMLRRTHVDRVPVVLAAAVVETARCLADLRAAAGEWTSVQDVLTWLDEARRARARDLGLDARRVVPFAARAQAPGVRGRSVEELLDEVCDPVHLAAARCWGWLGQ